MILSGAAHAPGAASAGFEGPGVSGPCAPAGAPHGSDALRQLSGIRQQLRAEDRLALTELNKNDHTELETLFARDRQVQVLLSIGLPRVVVFGGLLVLGGGFLARVVALTVASVPILVALLVRHLGIAHSVIQIADQAEDSLDLRRQTGAFTADGLGLGGIVPQARVFDPGVQLIEFSKRRIPVKVSS